jgi:hypothetical protein
LGSQPSQPPNENKMSRREREAHRYRISKRNHRKQDCTTARGLLHRLVRSSGCGRERDHIRHTSTPESR